MKKIFNYITYDAWWDTDVTIAPCLVKDFLVNMYVLTPKNNPKYEDKYIKGVAKMSNIVFPYRDRDIRSAWIAITCFKRIRSTMSKSDCVNYFVLGQNFYLLLLLLVLLPPNNTIICIHNYDDHQDGIKKRKSLLYYVKSLYIKKFKYFHFHSRIQNDLYIPQNGKHSFYTNMPLKDFGLPTTIKRYEGKTLLFFGLVRGYKRLDLLIEAVNKADASNVKVVIAGKCTNPEFYTKMIADKSKFDINFRFINNSEIANFFSSVDFLVLPYNNATQSGPSLIAINYGVPIIASDVASFSDIVVNNYNGFTFENGNVESLIKVIEKIDKMGVEEIKTMKINQLAYKSDYTKQNDISKAFNEFVTNIMGI